MRISDWSSDVCSSDLPAVPVALHIVGHGPQPRRLFARHLRFMCAPWLAARRFVMGARPLIVTIRLPPQSIDAPRGRLIVEYIGDRREFPGAVIEQPPPWLVDQLPAVAVKASGSASCRERGRQDG